MAALGRGGRASSRADAGGAPVRQGGEGAAAADAAWDTAAHGGHVARGGCGGRSRATRGRRARPPRRRRHRRARRAERSRRRRSTSGPSPVQRWSALDLARGAVGLAIAALGILLAVTATDTLGGLQADLARSVGRLPAPARTATIGLAQVGAVVAPVVLARGRGRHPPLADARRDRRRRPPRRRRHVAARARRHRPGPAGVVAGAGRARGWITGRAFPTSAYLAGAVAAVVVVVRWLGPRWSRTLWAAVAVLAVVRVVSGTNLPLDLVVAFGVGVAGGSAALLVVGSPDPSPPGAAVAAALRRVGVGLTALTEHERPPGHPHVPGGRPRRRPRRRRAQRRRPRPRRGRPALRTHPHPHGGEGELLVSVEEATERAAFMGLWLDRLGLRVAQPHAVARLATGAAVVAHDPVPGRPLSDGARTSTAGEMADAWRAIAALHAGHVAHGALDLGAVAVDGDGRRLAAAGCSPPPSTRPTPC